MDKLALVILDYESDTFSAEDLRVTRKEARAMAALLFDRLCNVVQEGGTLRSDGTVLADVLDQVRSA